MHDKSIGHATLVASVLMVLGCQESNPAKSELVEHMTKDAPTFAHRRMTLPVFGGISGWNKITWNIVTA